MIAATIPDRRSADAKLLVIDAQGRMTHAKRRDLVRHLRPGDLLIANDAATLPASLRGIHLPTVWEIEVRLATRCSLSPEDVSRFTAVVFGAGDFRTPTELRPLPPPMAPGDALALGPLRAMVTGILGHPRLLSLRFEGRPDAIWAGIACHGRPIQYSHLTAPLALWDVWTAIASRPVAFEPPSAGFVLDWAMLAELHARSIEFATITHAAGISSTGDDALDARLPLDEPYEIPDRTARAIGRARASGRRVVAVGTTVVRALEHAASPDGRVRAGAGIASQRIGPRTQLQIVNAIVSGVHEPGTSHFELLRAFADDEVLKRSDQAMNEQGYRTHEFGDSVLVERNDARLARGAAGPQPTGPAPADGGRPHTARWPRDRFPSTPEAAATGRRARARGTARTRW
ncbi:MAG: S-adenosylmethionine:tRNA ribosyltransferase-isomerase [Betaproteobacteria bacterium]